jgi:hypothetical protein
MEGGRERVNEGGREGGRKGGRKGGTEGGGVRSRESEERERGGGAHTIFCRLPD